MRPKGSVCLSIPRSDFSRLCTLFGPQLHLGETGSTLDGTRLLIALGGRESSFGARLNPRYERSYDAGGSIYRRSRELQQFIALHGSKGACSYGPLQVMAINAVGFSPDELARDPEAAMAAAAGHFNRYVIGHWKASTLEQICACWNAGSPYGITLGGYFEDVARYYEQAAAAAAGGSR